MDNKVIIERIVQGMDYYSEFLAEPSHMEHYDDGMCAWINPKEGANGASVVYKAYFGDKPDEEIRQIVSSYRKKGMPNEWFLTPLSTPKHIRGLLTEIDIKVSGDSFGMALPPEKMDIAHWEKIESRVTVRQVNSKDEFFTWANLVNDVLFNYQILDPEHYYSLFRKGRIICFLGYDDEPAAASAILNDNGNATLEFIATKPEHRRKGMGTAVCRAAIKQMLENGAKCISLRGTPEGMLLYKSLGFEKYFDF